MKHIILTLLFLTACEFRADCDKKIRDLYPDQSIRVLDVTPEVSVYLLGNDRYVSCNSAGFTMVIECLKPRTWTEAYCSRMVEPRSCMEAETKLNKNSTDEVELTEQ